MKTKKNDISNGGHIRSTIGLEILVKDVMTSDVISV